MCSLSAPSLPLSQVDGEPVCTCQCYGPIEEGESCSNTIVRMRVGRILSESFSVLVPRVERVGGVGPVQRQLWAGGPQEEEKVQLARGVRGGGQRGEGVQGGILSGVDGVGSLVHLLVLLWTRLQEQGQALCCAWWG